MFLLIREKESTNLYFLFFTFHNVSINTPCRPHNRHLQIPLHSTMFLLIQSATKVITGVATGFTFHNVSINTDIPQNLTDHHSSLHSTMFLLIQITLSVSSLEQQPLHSTMFLLIRHRKNDC